jgi:glycosyltransferase involved in cell wall biosynthesis
MKILILSDYFSPQSFGGAGIVSFADAKALSERGHDVSVITTTTDRSHIGEASFEGIRIFTIYSDYDQAWRGYISLYNPQVTNEVRKIMSRMHPDIVHAYNIHTYISYYSLKLARRSGAKVFITMHDVMAVHYGKFNEFIDLSELSVPKGFNYRITPWTLIRTFKLRYNPFRNMVIRHYLRYADKIFAVSGALKQVLNANDIGNVEVLHNSMDFKKWDAPAADVARFAEKLGLVGKKVVLFSGWVTAAKGGDQILEAFGKTLERVPSAVLVCAGRTDLYYSSMKEEAKKLGLGDKIVFTGWIGGPDLPVSYAAADLVVFPSVCFDTFGMVNLEAMASKKPVIATCFGGAPEVVEDGRTGYVVNPYDIDTMAVRIIELLSDADKARAFGQAGYERARRLFDKQKKIEELISWYERRSPRSL